jgi:hypothetical protein
MVPAALLGLDLDRLWGSALDMIRACGGNIMSELSPGAFLGAVMGALAQQGRDKLCVFTSPSIAAFGSWIEQLVAESTGKEGTGVLPVVGASVGKPHDYVSDRNFIYLKVDGDPGNPELDESVRALREAGHPRVTLMMRDTYALAGEFFRWEYATAIAGYILGINPFDELNVTESKQNTARLLDEYIANGALSSSEPLLKQDGVRLYVSGHTLAGITEICKAHGFKRDDLVQVLAAQIVGTRAGDYFALLAYLPQEPAIQAKLEDIRRLLRHTTKRAATIGFGPRYLHSTGQLHKGGPNNGIFFQLTSSPREDVPIPGKPFSFATLNAAQAAGDLEALNTHGRRSLRLHFDGDITAGLDLLVAALELADLRRA